MKTYFWNKKQTIFYFLSILVFLIHCPTFEYYNLHSKIAQCFYVFFKHTLIHTAVPLYMILSGFLYFRDYTNEKYVEKNKRRIRTLVIPYLLWNTLNTLLIIMARSFLSFASIEDKTIEINLKNILLGIFHYEYNGPFWFVFALIIFSLISPLIDLLLKNKTSSIITIVTLIILLYFNIGLPTSLFYNQSSIIYYLVGCFLGRFYLKWFSERKSLKFSLINLLLLIVLIVLYFFFYLYNISVNSILQNVLLICFGLSLWFSFDIFLSKDHISPNYTNHHFVIYGSHVVISSVLAKILYFLLPKSEIFCYINFLLTTILLLVSVEVFCFLANKYLPRFYRMLIGNR